MIIDVRLRPPFKGFKQQFSPAGNKALSAKFGLTSPESVQQVSEELMLKEMDEAGITCGLATGRNGHFRYNIPNDDLVDMTAHYKGRILGAAGLNCADVPQAMADVEKYVINGPLKAVSMEPGACPVPRYANDRRLYPIYEMCQAHKIPVILMLGGRAGPDVSYSNPEIISRIAADFPNARFMVSHGGWPWVQAVIGVCFWQEKHLAVPRHVPHEQLRRAGLRCRSQHLASGSLSVRFRLPAHAHRGKPRHLQIHVQGKRTSQTAL